MSDLDKKIELALDAATKVIEVTDEPTVVEDVLATFRGHYRGLMVMAWLKMIATSALLVFSIFQFFQQESVMAMLAYATLTTMCTVTIGCIYVLFWISLNKHTTNREVKRLELQIALLLQKLDSN